MAPKRQFLWFLGLTVVGGVSTYHVMKHLDDHLLRMYCKLPLNLVSSLTGKIMAVPIPTSMRPSIIGGFARTVNADMSEAADSDFSNYSTLNEFFTRNLKEGVRTFDQSERPAACQLFSPCDGKLLQITEMTDRSDGSHAEKSAERISVKNQSFMLSEFLGPLHVGNDSSSRSKEDDTESSLKTDYSARDLLHDKTNNSLYACIIYLSPRDCHRFYSPTTWNVHFARHFRGFLLSVNPDNLQKFYRKSQTPEDPNDKMDKLSEGDKLVRNLLSIQERCVLIGQWKHGFFAFSAVGATNVGSISINAFPDIHTNCMRQRSIPRGATDYFTDYLPYNNRPSAPPTVEAEGRKTMKYSSDGSAIPHKDLLRVNLGEEVGYFNLGSTIVLIFEAPRNLKFKNTDKMTIGQQIVLS